MEWCGYLKNQVKTKNIANLSKRRNYSKMFICCKVNFSHTKAKYSTTVSWNRLWKIFVCVCGENVLKGRSIEICQREEKNQFIQFSPLLSLRFVWYLNHEKCDIKKLFVSMLKVLFLFFHPSIQYILSHLLCSKIHKPFHMITRHLSYM